MNNVKSKDMKTKEAISKSFSEKADEMVNSILDQICNKLPFRGEINYISCTVEILKDDFSTIWVKWGKFDCKFTQLPIRAMATIADNIIRK